MVIEFNGKIENTKNVPKNVFISDERTNINTHLLEMPNTVMDNLHGKVYLNLCCHKKHLR